MVVRRVSRYAYPQVLGARADIFFGTKKLFDCSVFGGPTLRMSSRVFDVLRDLLNGYRFGTSVFAMRLNTFDNDFARSNFEMSS